METVIASLVIAGLQSIPSVIKAINESKTLNEEEKKAVLLNINIALTEANVRVQAVRFRDVDPVVTYETPKP